MKSTKYTKFFVGLVCLLVLGLVAATARPPRYVSAWVEIQSGGAYVFEHGLGQRPNVVYVWAKQVLLSPGLDTSLSFDCAPKTTLRSGCDYSTNEGPEDVEDVRPWTELPEHPVFIEDVDGQFVVIENHGDVAWTVQVVALP